MQILQTRNLSDPGRGDVRHRWATFEEERRELLESVVEALSGEFRDPTRDAACYALLRHLACAGA